MSIEDIRARCGASVTEMVSGPKEYGQSQQIIRDRAELLTAYDALRSQNTALIQQMGASVETERQMGERIEKLEAALREARTWMIESVDTAHIDALLAAAENEPP